MLEPNVEKYPAVVIKAFEGFKITDAAFTPYNANGAKYSVDVAADGQSASFHYTLTSGPAIDRYRGWIKGDFVVTMLPKTNFFNGGEK